jgi:hypothetical protein
MPGNEAVSGAVEELYSLDPDDFTKRRDALAAQARRDGDAQAARAITALRRPTKAAWIVNRLAREQPGTAQELAELAADLHKAQRALDGPRLRELTQRRRKLIDAAARKAFQLSGQADPSAALRNDVASTLEAALADSETAEQFTAGTLVRSAEWSGFGDSAPNLTAVPPLPAKSGPAKRGSARRGSTERAPAAKSTAAKADSSQPRAADQRRQERLAAAQDAFDEVSAELQAAEQAEQDQREKVERLSEQLADARRRLDEARLQTRRVKGHVREAQRRLDRADG